MNWILSWKTAFVIALLLLTGYILISNNESIWVLEDLARPEEYTRLKKATPHPVRKQITFTVHERMYQGDLYQPEQPPLASLVLVPGLAENGKDDSRLVALATTLARARFLILVPELPNLRALKVRSEDSQGVTDAFVFLRSQSELPSQSPTGIGAFSYAVGPAVLAALDPAICEQVDFVLGVGGYYDLIQVITFFTTGYFQKQEKWHYLEPNRYGKWVFVLGNAERLTDSVDKAMFNTIAKRKLANPHADINNLITYLTPEGLSLLELIENSNPERTPALISKLPESILSELDMLNLATKDLSQLQAQLILLHGTDDSIIPYTESMKLAEIVSSTQSNLFLIDGFAHVHVQSHDLDRFTLWRAIKALLAQRKDSTD
jgi:pimeloyl-ACP methyl ester carboxylesterase